MLRRAAIWRLLMPSLNRGRLVFRAETDGGKYLNYRMQRR